MPVLVSRSDIFTINDIDLVIPPTNIAIRKEDLTYNWRTLRTNVSTKIATGHGQMAVHLTIPFTSELLLDMHRLVIEFKQSPFAYVENQFLRQSIVPDWPLTQNMAFTLTSLNILPVPDSSDTWYVELDLQWFNYFPYAHNFLYRHDWNTRWVQDKDKETGEDFESKFSIGWKYNTPGELLKGIRLHSPSRLDRQPLATGRKKWDLAKDEYYRNPKKTLFDMEAVHNGRIFDLLPMPTNMEPAWFALSAAESKIYVRYINLLQRDALKTNFGINVEADLANDLNAFFASEPDKTGFHRTYGLHSDRVPDLTRSRWITSMLRHNGKVAFVYDLYQSLRLPAKWVTALDKYRQNEVGRLLKTGAVPGVDSELIVYEPKESYDQNHRITNMEDRADKVVWIRVPYRAGLRGGLDMNGDGFHVPVGSTIEECLSYVKNANDGERGAELVVRSFKKMMTLYAHNKIHICKAIKNNPQRAIHHGTDFSVPHGTPVYAVRGGTIISANLPVEPGAAYQPTNLVWYYYNLSDDVQDSVGKNTTFGQMGSPRQNPYYNTEATVETGTIERLPDHMFGDIIQSRSDPNIYFFQALSDSGVRIHMQHEEPNGGYSTSTYIHLSELSPYAQKHIRENHELVSGESRYYPIKAGQLIGFTGASGGFKKSIIQKTISNTVTRSSWLGRNVWNIRNFTQSDPEHWKGRGNDDPYAVSEHLHFEYHESIDVEKRSDTTPMGDDELHSTSSSSSTNRIMTDPLPTYRQAADKQRPDVVEVTAYQEDPVEAAERHAGEETRIGNITKEEGDALVNLVRSLDADGWRYYEDDVSVKNVWKKTMVHEVSRANHDQLLAPDAFQRQGIVFTGISGGLRHIVSSIPMLGHEFPTHQHLGSIEPTYSFEFVSLDPSLELTGLSPDAIMIQGMRSLLQSNARSFRPIVDSWTVATDTFLTRFLGSFAELDIAISGERNAAGSHLLLRKRTSISRSSEATIEGNPGLSSILLEMEETNPYEFEQVVAVSRNPDRLEKDRAKVLNKLNELALSGKYGDEILAAMILSFGPQQILKSTTPHTGTNVNVGDTIISTSYSAGPITLGKEGFSLRDPYGFYEKFLKSYSIDGKRTTGGADSSPLLGDEESGFKESDRFFRVDEQLVDSVLKPYQHGSTVGAAATIGHLSLSANSVFLHQTQFVDPPFYDRTEFAEANPEVATIDFDLIRDYYVFLQQVVRSANKVLCEEVHKGFSDTYLSHELYDLPIRAQQWAQFQYFYEQKHNHARSHYLSASHYGPWAPRPDELSTLPGYFENKLLDSTTKNEIADQVNDEDWPLLMWQMADVAKTGFFWFDRIQEIAGKGIHATEADMVRSLIVEARAEQVDYYIGQMPLQIYANDVLSESLRSMIGNFIETDSHVVKSMRLQSSYIGYLNSVNTLGPLRVIHKTGTSFVEEKEIEWSIINRGAARFLWNGVPGWPLAAVLVPGGLDPNSVAFQDAVEEFTVGGTAKFPCERVAEEEKISYFKQLLARLADEMLKNPDLLKIFDLEELAFSNYDNDYSGGECYPDLTLPSHPYYGDSFEVSPDFYMWNMYEDGGALSAELSRLVSENIMPTITGAHEWSYAIANNKSFTDPSNSVQSNLTVLESFSDDVIKSGLAMNPDGSQGYTGSMGATTSTGINYLPDQQQKEDEQVLMTSILSQSGVNPDATAAVANLQGPNSSRPPGFGQWQFSVSQTDRNIQYPLRIDPEKYKQLKTIAQDIDGHLFGPRLGLDGEPITLNRIPALLGRLQDTSVAIQPTYTHSFDKGSLKQIAIESANDIFSQKMSMKRAYPTFKLFFVEEDDTQDRFLNFDDFHSYNGVKEFSVVMSRDSAADTAVITLQNVSGTLDGTKRDTITDVDYFNQTKVKEIQEKNPEISVTEGNEIVQDTPLDQPFGSVMLRPGLNVQLHTGYSNNPSNLAMLVSGRIVDLTWSATGDLVEIVVQSYGVELVQSLKGSSPSMKPETSAYWSTHQLLGSLMITSPEVVHFGRWQFGDLRQIGEESNYKLDFTDYSQAGFSGRWKIANWTSQWVLEHPLITMGATLGLVALGLMPSSLFPRVLGLARGAKAGQTLLKAERIFLTEQAAITAAEMEAAGTAGATTLNLLVREEKVRRGVLGVLNQTVKTGVAMENAGVKAKYIADIAKIEGFVFNTENGVAELLKFSQPIIRRWEARGVLHQVIGYAVWSAPKIGVFRRTAGAIWSGINFVGWRAMNFSIQHSVLSSVVVAAAFGNSVPLDILRRVIHATWYRSGGTMKRALARKKANFFLDPRDDNLFPPSPKDYMRVRKFSIKEEVASILLTVGNKALFGGASADGMPQIGGWAGMIFKHDDPAIMEMLYSKRVLPTDCKYHIISSTIWEVFREMTLRHPGWIHAVRPYGAVTGSSHKYTLFFGIPSQRYWSRPASNRFVDRMNKLRNALESEDGVSIIEYKQLYGNFWIDGKTQIDDYLAAQRASLLVSQAISNVNLSTSLLPSSPYPSSSSSQYYTPPLPVPTASSVGAEENEKRQLTGRALKEYMHGLQARFIPFRRYHMFNSERDIVWNGIVSSESSVTNAIDVAYFNNEDPHTPQGTFLCKASSQLPDYLLRVAPIAYPNCKGYNMALRYGMGELIHRMKEMYRGELIILGNANVRPWDIGILADSYNDMVGPIEVEQVVHNFSHETGFITEIKPSAVVFGNELASWPILEAMKVFALAVVDAEQTFDGSGMLHTAATAGVEWGGPEFNRAMLEKYRRLFPGNASIQNSAFDGTVPDLANGEAALATQEQSARLVAAGAMFGIAAMATIGTIASWKAMPVAKTVATLVPAEAGKLGSVVGFGVKAAPIVGIPAGIATAGVALTAGGIAISSRIDFPGLAWLIGGPIIMLKCLREDSIALIPLMKGGSPIVAGLSFGDSSMMWTHMQDQVRNYANDLVTGTHDLTTLWSRYGAAIWRELGNNNIEDLTGGATLIPRADDRMMP